MSPEQPRVGYVVKRYPRFSETFIVTEILAHEAAGLSLDIFALRPPVDSHFQDGIARVRAPVTYVPGVSLRCDEFWAAVQAAAVELPAFWPRFAAARGADARDVFQAIHLALAVRARGISHLHAHFATAATTVTRLAARLAGVPYTCTVHAKDLYHESVDAADLGQKLRDAATVVTVSEYNTSVLRERFNLAVGRVERIYNGLALERFPYTSPVDRPSHIVAVGRLVEKKGFADLLEACALLMRGGRSFTCTVIGGGPQEAVLHAQAERLGLRGVVHLVGARPQPDVIAAVQDAAVLAAPCVVGGDGDRDGLPTVLLEAMALGTPCVATPVTGIPEIIMDGHTGLLAPSRDPAALAGALGRLLDDAGLRERLAAAARVLIASEFDTVRTTAHLRRLFSAATARTATAA